jgi:hypothetical protein
VKKFFFSLLNESTHNNELASQHRKLYIHQEKEFFQCLVSLPFREALNLWDFFRSFSFTKTFRFESGENCAKLVESLLHNFENDSFQFLSPLGQSC